MSVRVMSLVWDDEELSATDKIVMLSLADHADDDGYCYPSIARLERRTGLAKRTVQNAIQRLKSGGKLAVNLNAGRGHANLYRVTPAPASYAPPQQMHPAADAPLPLHMTTHTPAADAPKPSRTIIEPSIKKTAKPKLTQIPESAVISDGMIEAAAKRGHSLQEAEAQFEKFKVSAISKARTYANWNMAFVTWLDSPYFRTITGGRNDRSNAQRHAQNGQRPDPALEQIARLAGIGGASGDGGF